MPWPCLALQLQNTLALRRCAADELTIAGITLGENSVSYTDGNCTVEDFSSLVPSCSRALSVNVPLLQPLYTCGLAQARNLLSIFAAAGSAAGCEVTVRQIGSNVCATGLPVGAQAGIPSAEHQLQQCMHG